MASVLPPNFADLLRHARRAAGFTQEALAERAGISARTVADLERGINRAPRTDTLDLLADALDLPPDERNRWQRLRRCLATPDHPRTPRSVLAPPRSTALPVFLTDLIGRGREISAVSALVWAHRLVTLTGAGGSGKTRVAVAVGHAVSADFPAGVVFIDLSAITQPSLVVPTIAASIGVRDAGGEALLVALAHAIGQRQRLLILDNCERVIDAAPEIGAVLRQCPHLAVLATSRVPLHLTGEHVYPLGPLSVPVGGRKLDIEALAATPAVALFIDRAQAVQPAFRLTSDNAPAIADLCQRLDGLPLAIELAAARVRLFSPQEMLARVDHPLQLLAGGPRDLPARQKTMRTTIQWSYDLLRPAEQRLLRSLSVFAAGWTTEGAAALAAAAEGRATNSLDVLQSLVEQSLVVEREQSDGTLRFGMLETIREFASDQLHRAGEADAASAALTAYVLRRVEAADLNEEPPATFLADLDWLEREHANLRAALDWSCDRDHARFVSLLLGVFHLWGTRGYVGEGRRYLQVALDCSPVAPVAIRAQLLDQAGSLATLQGDTAEAMTLHHQSLQLCQDHRDERGVGRALYGLGRAAHFSGDYAHAAASYERALDIARSLHDDRLIAVATGAFGAALGDAGDIEREVALVTQALAMAQAQGSYLEMAVWRQVLAAAVWQRGDAAHARRLLQEGLHDVHRVGLKWLVAAGLTILGQIEAAAGAGARGARLVGAGLQLQQTIGYVVPAAIPWTDRYLKQISEELGEEQFRRLLAEGAAMDVAEAVAYALAETNG